MGQNYKFSSIEFFNLTRTHLNISLSGQRMPRYVHKRPDFVGCGWALQWSLFVRSNYCYLFRGSHPIINGLFPIKSSIFIQILCPSPLFVDFARAGPLWPLTPTGGFRGAPVRGMSPGSLEVSLVSTSKAIYTVPRGGHSFIFLSQLLYIFVSWMLRNSTVSDKLLTWMHYCTCALI